MLTILFGILAVGYGIFTLYARFSGHDSWLEKLPKMQEKFGYIPGLVMHWVFYTLFPIAVGVLFLVCKFCFDIDIL